MAFGTFVVYLVCEHPDDKPVQCAVGVVQIVLELGIGTEHAVVCLAYFVIALVKHPLALQQVCRLLAEYDSSSFHISSCLYGFDGLVGVESILAKGNNEPAPSLRPYGVLACASRAVRACV